MEVIIQLGIFLGLLLLGYGAGRYRERGHFRRLAKREDELRVIGITNLRRLPPGVRAQCCGLVTGSAVIATDYFKVFASSLRNLFGGEVRSLGTLVERARREALVRMMTQAAELGADTVANVRYETGTVGGQRKNSPGGVEVLAYGTALNLGGVSAARP